MATATASSTFSTAAASGQGAEDNYAATGRARRGHDCRWPLGRPQQRRQPGRFCRQRLQEAERQKQIHEKQSFLRLDFTPAIITADRTDPLSDREADTPPVLTTTSQQTASSSRAAPEPRADQAPAAVPTPPGPAAPARPPAGCRCSPNRPRPARLDGAHQFVAADHQADPRCGRTARLATPQLLGKHAGTPRRQRRPGEDADGGASSVAMASEQKPRALACR
jgi:hypothetical protein